MPWKGLEESWLGWPGSASCCGHAGSQVPEPGTAPAVKVEILILFLIRWLRLVSSINHEVSNSLQVCPFISLCIWRDLEVLLHTWKNVCWVSQFYVLCVDTFRVGVSLFHTVTITQEKILSLISFQFATYNFINSVSCSGLKERK